jgi:6-phosphogluconolactonase
MTRFVYVSCGNDRTIRIHTLAAGGTLGSIATVSIPGTDQPSGSTPMAVHPNRRLLYVALRTPPYPVTSFAIDQSTGGLTPVATAPLPDSMAYIATDPTGRWLLSA